MDMRGELLYRDGYTSRTFRTNSDDVLFGVPIITIYLPCMRYRCKRQTMRQSLKSTPPIIGDVASCIRPEDYLTMA